MAGRRLELIIVFSGAGGLGLSVVALAVLALANPRFSANHLMLSTLVFGAIPWSGIVLWLQVSWLCFGGEHPDNVILLLVTAMEWVVGCFTIGTACAAITVNKIALQYDYCAARVVCALYLVAAVIACAAGALATVSALGMLWIHGSRFRPAQAP